MVTTGCYILMQNPLTNNYPYLECVNCMLDIFDEVLIVDGGTTDGSFDLLPKDNRIKIKQCLWAEDASWNFLTQQYDFGLQNLTTDWRVKIDADYIFHENDIDSIKKIFQEHQDEIGVCFEKSCFILSDRYRSKSKILLAVNYKLKPDFHWNTNDELIADKLYDIGNTFKSGIRLYVYDRCFQTKENIGNVMQKLAIAAKEHGYNWGYGTKQDAIDFIISSGISRVDSHQQSVLGLGEHPKYIQEKIKNMTDDMLGYSLFGHKKARYFEKN